MSTLNNSSTQRHMTLLLAFVLSLAASRMAYASQPSTTRGFAADIGVTPESMVVAGFSLQETTIVLNRIQAAQTIREELGLLAASSDNAVLALAMLQQALAEAPGDQNFLNQIQQATEEVQAIATAITLKRTELQTLALADFPAAKIQRLTIWKNGSAHRVPASFRTALRSEDQWKSIVQALRAERRATIRDEPLDPQFIAILQPVYEDQLVIDADLAMQLHFENMKALFATYTN